jgi:hypothetical protein
MFIEVNQIHNFMSSSGSGTVINYGSGSDFLTTYGSGSGSLEPRTAIEGSFSAWGGLGKLDRGLGRGETFFPDSDSDRDSDETFQISRNLGLVHVEFFCLLDSQPCQKPQRNCMFMNFGFWYGKHLHTAPSQLR